MDRREGTLGDTLPEDDLPVGSSTLLPGPRRVVAARPRRVDADNLLDDARQAMSHELAKLKRRAGGAVGLDHQDIKSLALLTDAACKLAREERDAMKADELHDLDDDTLKTQTQEAMEEL